MRSCLAHQTNTAVIICAISPLADPTLRCRVRDALTKAAAIVVRDRHARQLSMEIGVEGDRFLTVDPAMPLDPDSLRLEEILKVEERVRSLHRATSRKCVAPWCRSLGSWVQWPPLAGGSTLS